MLYGSIITRVVSRIKADFGHIFEREGLEQLCYASGSRWRNRLLPPARTIELLLIQMLHGNTAISHLRHIVGFNFTASAYCQARSRIPLEALQRILGQLGKRFIAQDAGRWLGHKTYLIDGSSFSTPDTRVLRKHFGYPSGQQPGCGFPMGHLLALFHARTGMIQSLIPAEYRTHDMSQVTLVHPALGQGDVLVGDRAFCSFTHVALLQQRATHAVLRMHQALQILKLRCLRKIAQNDRVIEWRKPKKAPSWLSEEQFDKLPQSIAVRWISYRIQRKGFRSKGVSIITTLLDNRRYTVDELAKLYHSRWEIETNLNHLKTTMKMDVLRCKNVAGILKELYAFAIVYNLVRIVMLQAAKQQNTPINRVSFIDALRWLCHSATAAPLIILIINPHRPGRSQPRAIKRRPKQYDRLNKPRNILLRTLKKAA